MNRRTRAEAGTAVLILIWVWVGSGYLFSARTPERDLEITTLENVEYLAVLLNLTSYWEMERPHHPFAVSTRQGFLPFRKHTAVRQTHSLVRKTSPYDLLHLALLFSGPPHLKPQASAVRGFRRASLRSYLSALRDFHGAADWGPYWERQRSRYLSWRRELEGLLDPIDPIVHLEGFFRMNLDAYVLIFTPHLTRMRMSRSVESGGQETGYVIFGPREPGSDKSAGITAEGLLQKVIFREFGRLFVLKGLAVHENLLEKHKHLRRYFKNENPQSLPWRVFFLRRLSSGLEIRLIHQALGAAAGEAALEEYTSQGGILVVLLAEILQEYEQARGRFATFVDFLPVLFKKMNERITLR